MWARLVGPVVEQVAQRLVHGQSKTARPIVVPTLLSQANRSDGRDHVRTKARRGSQEDQKLPNACRECGTILATRSRKYCDACLPAARERAIATFSESGRQRKVSGESTGVFDQAFYGSVLGTSYLLKAQAWVESTEERGETTRKGLVCH